MMKSQKTIRERLLIIGMGIFAFTCGVTAVNVLALPFARTFHGYMTGLVLASFAVSAALFLLIGRRLRMAREGALERAARIAPPVYLVAMFVIHVAMGYFMEYTPGGDNFMIYTSAQMLVTDGNFDAYPDFYLYLSRFSNQWGLMLMLSALYRLLFALGFTQMFFPTALVEAALYTAGLAATLACARHLRGARGVLLTLAMLVLCLPMYLAAAVLYTDTFSLPFVMMALLGVLRALDAKTLRAQVGHTFLAALSAAIGGQIKMTVAIVVIAAVILFCLRLRRVAAAICSAVMVVTLCASMFIVRGMMIGPILDEEMVREHNMPLIHWVMMTIPTGRNPYGAELSDYGITWGMSENGVPREQVMESIYERLIDKIYYMRYPNRLIPGLLRKNATAFGDGTFGMTEMLDDSPKRENVVSSVVLEGRPYYEVYFAICTGVFYAHLTFATLACVRDIRRRDLRCALLYIAALGLILFMLLWESKSRYIFNFVPVILLLSMGFAARGAKEEDAA